MYFSHVGGARVGSTLSSIIENPRCAISFSVGQPCVSSGSQQVHRDMSPSREQGAGSPHRYPFLIVGEENLSQKHPSLPLLPSH